MIVAAGATGGPVVSSAYPEWIATYMLEQNNGYYPLPVSMSNALAYLFPATAQAYWDEVLEHAFAANQARLGSAKINLPTALVVNRTSARDDALHCRHRSHVSCRRCGTPSSTHGISL